MARLSVIIPALNAAPFLEAALLALDAPTLLIERIVVDGGSDDDTVARAKSAGALVVTADRGRGSQLAAGASAASGDWLLFLHADTVLDPGWAEEAQSFMAASGPSDAAAVFRFALDDGSAAARRLETMVAWRCRTFALPYGDQGLLISRKFYDAIGGYKSIPLFEDVDIVRRIGGRRLTFLKTRAVTSAARYKQSGYVFRPVRNLLCMALYRIGVPPRHILRFYG